MTVYLLWNNNADSWSGRRIFIGVFATPEAATQHVINSYKVWQRDPSLPLEPYFSIEPTEVQEEIRPLSAECETCGKAINVFLRNPTQCIDCWVESRDT